jgi:Zn-dependent peptidase ImmA (M78 family)
MSNVRKKLIRNTVENILEKYLNQEIPPVPIKKIISDFGIFLKEEPAEDSLSGFILIDSENKRTIIGVNRNHHDKRKRFSMAHELGHYLLHHNEGVHIDHKVKIMLRNEDSRKGINSREKEANLFAAELLMPAMFLKEDIEKINNISLLDENDEKELKELANKYNVSTQALTFRLIYLGYFSYQW